MKKTNRTILAMTAAVVAITGCVKENLAPQGTEDGMVTVTLIADDATTKTQMNADGNNVEWSADELKYFYADQKLLTTAPTQTIDETSGKISLTMSLSEGTKSINGFIGGIHDSNAEIINKDTKECAAFGIEVPAHQTTTTKSFDPKADVLVMTPKTDLTPKDLKQPITGIKFNRLNAITKLVLTPSGAAVGEQVLSVKFITTSIDLAGSYTYDYAHSKFIGKNGTEITTGSKFTKNPSKEITLYYPGLPKIKEGKPSMDAYMVSAATTLPADEVVTIIMTTNQGEYVKTIKLSKEFQLKNTQLNKITVSLPKSATKVYAFDMTTAPTLGTTNDGANSFSGVNKYRYDNNDTPSLVLNTGDDMVYYQPTDATPAKVSAVHRIKTNQSFTIEGEEMTGIDFFYETKRTNETLSDITTDGKGDVTNTPTGASWKLKTGATNGRHKITFTVTDNVNMLSLTKIIVKYTANDPADVRFTTELSAPITEFAADATSETVQTVELYNTRFDLDPLKITATDPNTDSYTEDTAPNNFKVTPSNKTGEGNKLTISTKNANTTSAEITESVWIYNKYTSYKLNLKQLGAGCKTFEFNTAVEGNVQTIDEYKFTIAQGDSSNSPAFAAIGIQLKKGGNKLTIEAPTKKLITKIEFTTKNNLLVMGTNNNVWEGESNRVTFTQSSSDTNVKVSNVLISQIRITTK